MPATDRMALSRKARAAGRTAVDTPPARSPRVWAEVLRELPIFAGLSARHIRRIAGLSVVARFEAKAPIVTAGDPGEAFYEAEPAVAASLLRTLAARVRELEAHPAD